MNNAELVLISNVIEKDVLCNKIVHEEASKISALGYAQEIHEKYNLAKNQATTLELNFNELKIQKNDLHDKLIKNNIETSHLKNDCIIFENELLNKNKNINMLSNLIKEEQAIIEEANYNQEMLKLKEIQLTNKNSSLEFDVNKKSAEINLAANTNKLLEKELF